MRKKKKKEKENDSMPKTIKHKKIRCIYNKEKKKDKKNKKIHRDIYI